MISKADQRQIERLTRAETSAEARRLERQVVAGVMVAPRRGMFVNADEWRRTSPQEKSRRVLATLSDVHANWTFCLFSAAVIYGLEVGSDDLDLIHRQWSKQARQKKGNVIIIHHSKKVESCLIDGIRVTPPLQTVVDCLCSLGFGRALAIADSAMRVLGLTKDAMREELALRGECTGWKIARDAITYANPLSMNGGESVARAVMIEQGFMIPQLQAPRRDPLNPDSQFFVDFLWNLEGRGLVVGELDGKDKYVLPEMTGGRDVLDVMRDERLRESRISAEGVRVMRFSYRDVMDVNRFTRMLELYGIPRGVARLIGK